MRCSYEQIIIITNCNAHNTHTGRIHLLPKFAKIKINFNMEFSEMYSLNFQSTLYLNIYQIPCTTIITLWWRSQFNIALNQFAGLSGDKNGSTIEFDRNHQFQQTAWQMWKTRKNSSMDLKERKKNYRYLTLGNRFASFACVYVHVCVCVMRPR